MAGVFFSCKKEEAPVIEASINCTAEVMKSSVNVWVGVNCNSDWTLSTDFSESGTEWAEFTKKGSGEHSVTGIGDGLVLLCYGQNSTSADRSLNLVLRSGSVADTGIFVQRSYDIRVKDIPDKVPGWMELPACDNPNLEYYNHDMTVGGKNYRNYSFYYDASRLVAHWVAYPMWKTIMWAGGRTDAWGTKNPKISDNRQQILNRSYGQAGYDRGHQLPSRDRCITGAANVQTFYGTNMTPQLSSLNQRGWASLEGKVFNWTTSFDTLYIVTGCCVEDSKSFVRDNDGKSVAVPTAYYKALLGYVKEDNAYHSIAFYYPHEAYSGGCESKALTVAELEDKLKNSHSETIDFFTALPSTKKASVKSQDYSHWISITD